MIDLSRLLVQARKLQGRSAHELRVRGVQALLRAAERWGLSSQNRLPSDRAFLSRSLVGVATAGELLTGFRTQQTPRFFPGLFQRDATLACLRARWPHAERELIERAERIRAGEFDLLGRSGLSFGTPINWRFDPVSGKTTPLVHWSRIDHLDPEQVGEYKVTWELNRHQHFFHLGQAYWCTGDERYAETFVEHLIGWMDANPPARGINWASSLEVAFRAIAWVWALHFFRESPRLTPEIFLRTLRFLDVSGRHLERFPSTYFSPNTHLTGEALGLFVLGTMLPQLRAARRWREMGLRILLEQVGVQIRSDGVYFEQASYYHRYTTDFYTHFLILSRVNGLRLPTVVESRLQAMLDHLMWIQRPDGMTPLYGDDDGGRLVWLDHRPPNDFRAALSTGAALFGREDFRFAAAEPAEETLWLLGPDAIRAFDRLRPVPPPETSRAFPQSGYFVMRDGWTSNSNYMLVDCGPHGSLHCGHAHADALSIEVCARGEPMLADPGTFTYIHPRELRDHFRSTAAHSTLVLEEESSSVPAGPFQWAAVAGCSLHSWIARERFDFFSGSHDGYRRLAAPAVCTRSVLFLKGDYWIVRDHVTSRGEHRANLHFQFAPGVCLTSPGQGLTAVGRGGSAARFDLYVFDAEGPIEQRENLFSRWFGDRCTAPAAVAPMGARMEAVSFLVPRARDERRGLIQAVVVEGGRCFRFTRDAAADELLIRSGPGHVVAGEAVSDFEWSWIRRRTPQGSITEYVLLAGSRLRVGSTEVFRCAGHTGYVAARRDGSLLLVETDATGELLVDPLGAREVLINGRPIRHPGEVRDWTRDWEETATLTASEGE